MKHTCHARGCSAEVSPKLFMCRRHWFMVPEPLRAEVLRHFQPSQVQSKRPTQAWLTAARKAIDAVHLGEHPGSAPLRNVIAWSMPKPLPKQALLECGHVVEHHDWEGRTYLGAKVNGHMRKIRARELLMKLPSKKRCLKCGQSEPLFERMAK